MKTFKRTGLNFSWPKTQSLFSVQNISLALLLLTVAGCTKKAEEELTAGSNLISGKDINKTSSAAAAAAAPETFYIAVLPDTQYYTEQTNGGSIGMFTNQIDWIMDNRASLNIKYVAHVGDVTDNGDRPGYDEEWNKANTQITRMHDAVNPEMPYGLAVGNHDQWCNGDAGSGATNNGYGTRFGKDRFMGTAPYYSTPRPKKSWYGAPYGSSNNNDNHWDKFTAGNQKYLVLYIEYNEPEAHTNEDHGDCPNTVVYSPTITNQVMAWARDVVLANLDSKVIIVSHSILTPVGGISGIHGAKAGQALPANDPTKNPQTGLTKQGEIISAFAANTEYPNIFMMLCGHKTGEGYRKDVYSNHVVKSFLSDYQGREVANIDGTDAAGTATKGGDGWMRIMKFNQAAGTIEIRTIQPLVGPNGEESDADSKFTVSMYN